MAHFFPRHPPALLIAPFVTSYFRSITTMLHLLGFNHTKLTYRFQGRDFRFTDVHCEVVEKLLA